MQEIKTWHVLNCNQQRFALLISEFKVVECLLFASEVRVYGGKIQFRYISCTGFFDEATQLPFMHCLEAAPCEGLMDRSRSCLSPGELNLASHFFDPLFFIAFFLSLAVLCKIPGFFCAGSLSPGLWTLIAMARPISIDLDSLQAEGIGLQAACITEH